MYFSVTGRITRAWEDEIEVQFDTEDAAVTVSAYPPGEPQFYLSMNPALAERIAREILGLLEQRALEEDIPADTNGAPSPAPDDPGDEVRDAHVFPDDEPGKEYME